MNVVLPGFAEPSEIPTKRTGVRSPRRWLMVTLAVATAAAVNLPVYYLFVRAVEGGWTRYVETVFSDRTLWLTLRTLALVVGVLAVAVPLAVVLAWLVARTDLPGRRLWAVAAALPLVFPSYVAALTLVSVFGPRGFLQKGLAAVGIEQLPELAYGYSGALLVLALFTYPYVYLLAVAALRGIDGSIEEASQSLGFGRWGTFRLAVLPQLRPAILSGGLLIVLYTLSDFGAVSIVRFNTFTLSIYNAYRALFDRTAAASLATVLVLLTAASVLLEVWWVRRLRPSRRRVGRPPRRVPLGRWKWPALAGLSAVAMVNLVTPIGVVMYWGIRALWLQHELGEATRAAVHSLAVALPTALIAVVLSLPIAFWATRFPSIPARLVQSFSYAGYALPGLVVALAMVFFSIRVARPLYQSLALLIAAYTVRFLPEAISAARASMAALAPRFEEAARALGGTPLRVARTVTLPLIRNGLLAGGGLVFLTTLKELPATLVLRPTGFETLATLVWSAASEGIYSQAAVPALWLVLVSALPVYFWVVRPGLGERRS
jgi:iron(III) transport system permease protein